MATVPAGDIAKCAEVVVQECLKILPQGSSLDPAKTNTFCEDMLSGAFDDDHIPPTQKELDEVIGVDALEMLCKGLAVRLAVTDQPAKPERKIIEDPDFERSALVFAGTAVLIIAAAFLLPESGLVLLAL